jgi:hypothetical protein
MKNRRSRREYPLEIPNIIFDLKLNPYDFFVYVNLCKLAGEDYEYCLSLTKLSVLFGIGKTRLREAVKALEKGSNELNLRLIQIIRNKTDDGGNAMMAFKILDLPEGGF